MMRKKSQSRIFALKLQVKLVVFSIGCLFLLGSCTAKKLKSEFSTLNPPTALLDPSAKNHGCLGMMNQYCDSLYAPGADGNLIIQKRKGTPIYILQGKTSNGLHQVFYELAKSKIRNREFFPTDFYAILRAHRYFQKLEELIDRKAITTMSMIDRIESNELESDVEYLWGVAIRDTLMTRVSKKFPDFPKLSDESITPEISHFEKLERRNLLTQISHAIWKAHPNWTKVTLAFENLQKNFVTVINHLDIPNAVKTDWKARIESVALVLPGSMPDITDQDCSSTTINAYYYSNLNVLTVCAGDFNSEDILLTLAHEMSHALDIDRSLELYFEHSQFSQHFSKVSADLCHIPQTEFSCEKWAEFKSSIDEYLPELASFHPDLPKLNECLKREKTTRILEPTSIERFSKSVIKERIRNLADEEAFLRITQQKLPLRNGKKVNNPSYLNPCHYLQSKFETQSLDSELNFLTAFTAEFECSKEKDQAERLRKSIVFAQDLMTSVVKNEITSEGQFSDRKSLVDENFSSSPAERFADLLGSYVVAEAMKSDPSLWDRRMTFFASNSWQCSGPSLSTAFPKETLLMRQYLQDSHTDGDERKKEVLSAPIREALSCEQDFQWNECKFSQE
jgi:hypothetical protein